jgi:hypothetical protein
MVEVLVDVVIEYAALLDRSPDDVVDPDVAVKHMESLSGLLRQLSLAERGELLRIIEKRAAEFRLDPADREFAAWLDNMPSDFGLLD